MNEQTCDVLYFYLEANISYFEDGGWAVALVL